MKKKYESPVQQVHQLSAQQMMAASLRTYTDSDIEIENSSNILTKQDATSDKSLWDQEW